MTYLQIEMFQNFQKVNIKTDISIHMYHITAHTLHYVFVKDYMKTHISLY